MRAKLPDYQVRNIFTGKTSESFSDEENQSMPLALLVVKYRNALMYQFGQAQWIDDEVKKSLDSVGICYQFIDEKMEIKPV